MNKYHASANVRAALENVERQLNHLFHGLPFACHQDYWYQDELARLQQSRSYLLLALEQAAGKTETTSDNHMRRRRLRRERAFREKRYREFRSGKFNL